MPRKQTSHELAQRALSIERCKTYGHAWYEQSIDSSYTPLFGTPVWLECERCGTRRKELWDVHGNIAHRRYEHPADWKQHAKFASRAERRLHLTSTMTAPRRRRRAS
jgi:hypothetical protein